MRLETMILLVTVVLPTPLAHAQVINGQSTYESNLQPRPSVELEDSTLVPKPRPRHDDVDTEPDRDSRKSLYPSR